MPQDDDRRELVEQLLREVHLQLENEYSLERSARCYTYLHSASLAIDVGDPVVVDDVSGFVAEVLDGRDITHVTEHEFVRLAADRLYSLAEVPA